MQTPQDSWVQQPNERKNKKKGALKAVYQQSSTTKSAMQDLSDDEDMDFQHVPYSFSPATVGGLQRPHLGKSSTDPSSVSIIPANMHQQILRQHELDILELRKRHQERLDNLEKEREEKERKHQERLDALQRDAEKKLEDERRIQQAAEVLVRENEKKRKARVLAAKKAAEDAEMRRKAALYDGQQQHHHHHHHDRERDRELHDLQREVYFLRQTQNWHGDRLLRSQKLHFYWLTD